MNALCGKDRRLWLLIAHLLAMTICLAWLAASPGADAPQELALPPAEPIAPGDTAWVGVGGCAAAACHGGPAGGPRGEYTTWIAKDPHSRAYSVLFGETSLQVANQLAGGDATRATAPHEDRRCLACHAPTGPLTNRTHEITGDGVGCEACHGAAEKWVTQHSTIRWKDLSTGDRSAKRHELGMTDMLDVLTRAQQCTPCHVGHGESDVNHDLIAAGHPRLSFELGAFHNQLPKHWPHEEERRREPAFEAKLWAVGHATSAAAHDELTTARAELGNGIEFANYDCYSCHHELKSPSTYESAAEGQRPGELRRLSWYYPHAFISRATQDANLPSLKMPLTPGNVQPEDLRKASSHLARELKACAAALNNSAEWSERSVDSLELALAQNSPPSPSWDEATQWYLAVVALERSRLDYRGDAPLTEQDEAIQRQLQAIKKLLDFPATSSGTALNSPRDFDPAAFKSAADQLRRSLAFRKASGGGAP